MDSAQADFDAADQSARIADFAEAYRASPEFAAYRKVLAMEAIERVIGKLCAKGDPERQGVVEVLASALDHFGAGSPQLALTVESLRSDADWWAEFASPPELETYAAAALRAIGDRNFGLTARKRLLVLLWDGLSTADRRAFLAAVDPDNRFRGKAA